MSRAVRGSFQPRARASRTLLLVHVLSLSLAVPGLVRAQARDAIDSTRERASDERASPERVSPDTLGGEQRAMAETLFFAGRDLMDAQRYAEACTKLAESYRLDPASGTLLNLAVCHEKEGKLASAWGEFRQAVAEAQRAARSDREELARTHADTLAQQLSFLAIDVPAETLVPGLEIVRNGVTMQPAAWTTELPVDPGEVQVLLRAPGYTSTLQTLRIARGQHRTMTLGPLLKAPSHEPSSGWTSRRKTGLGLLIGGALAAAVGGGTGVHALRLRDTSNEQCPRVDGELRCSQAGVGAMSSARKWALASDLALGVGALSVAVGAYLFATGAADRRSRAPMRASTTEPGRTATGALRADAAQWSWDVAAGRRGVYGTLFRSF